MNITLSQLRSYLPTPRLVLLLLLPIFLWIVGGWLRLAAVAGWGVLATAVFLIYIDIQRSVQPQQLSLLREHHHKLLIRADNEVVLQLSNSGSRAVQVTLRDTIPATFRMEQRQRQQQVTVPPHQAKRLPYQVQPTRRGEYRFGPVALRWPSAFGLFIRQVTFDLVSHAKVYPNLLEIKLYDQLARQGQMAHSGLRTLRHKGEGGEFEQLRDYLPDDDYRRISWKATAKYGKPITMEFSPERSQNIMVLVDTGLKMMKRPLGEARITRLDLIINAVLMFSYVALTRADRVGLLTFDQKIHRYVAPRSGMGQFYQLVEALHDVTGNPVEPDYGSTLRYLQANRHSRSLILLLTDPTGQEAAQGLVQQLGAFYPQHLPMCVVLSDPAVLDAAKRRPYSTDAIYQRAVAEQIIDERQLWLSQLNQRGVMTLDVPAHQMTAAVINRYLEMKENGRF